MSTILVDNLTGKTSAGSITVTSEGGAATQSLQQGLAKAWISMTSAAVLQDSLNVSSAADNGTGDFQVNFSNNMNNSDYSAIPAVIATATRIATIDNGATKTTSDFDVNGWSVGTSRTDIDTATSVHGDLA